jgi:hypothetical protein
VRDRIELVDKQHPKISMRKQSKLLGVARSTITYRPVEEDPEDIRIKRLLDEIYMNLKSAVQTKIFTAKAQRSQRER